MNGDSYFTVFISLRFLVDIWLHQHFLRHVNQFVTIDSLDVDTSKCLMHGYNNICAILFIVFFLVMP